MSTAGKEAAKKPEEQKVISSNQQKQRQKDGTGRGTRKDPDDERVVDSDEAGKEQHDTDKEAEVAGTGVALGMADGEYYEYHEDYLVENEPSASQPDDGSKDAVIHIGLVGGYGFPAADEIDGSTILGLAVGGTSKTHRIGGELRGLVSFPRLTDATGITEGVHAEQQLEFDAAIHLYATPNHTFVGFYFMAGVRFGILNWDYKNPIKYSDGSGNIENINDDSIRFGAPYVGAGFNFVQTRYFMLGANLTGGYKIYSKITGEGFDNDVLNDHWEIQLFVKVASRFEV